MRRPPQHYPDAVLSLVPASERQKRLAALVLGVSLAIFLAAAPFATTPWMKVPAFLPFYQSALCINDAITALLLFGQARAGRSRPLWLLACGYVFTAAMTLTHLLTYPDVFSPGGLLGAGTQTTAWLYMFWHAGFPVVVIAYAFLPHDQARSVSRARIVAGVLGAAALAALLTLLATRGHDWLPVLLQDHRYTGVYPVVSTTVWVLAVIAAASLWRRSHRTVLDLWLVVVMCAWVFDVALGAVLNGGRYDLGFYVGRIYGMLAASFVLMVLLFEHSVLHAKLVRSREKERRQAQELADVAAEQAARREHESSRKLLETVVRQMPGGLAIADAAGRKILVNDKAEKMLGGAVLGAREGMVITTPDFPRGRNLLPGEHPLERALAGEVAADLELAVERPGSARVVVSANAAPVHDMDGRLMGAVAAFTDITARKEAELERRDLLERAERARAEAEVANRTKDEFLAMLGHELRNPLAPIRTALQLLRMRAEASLSKEHIIIERQVEHLVHLVDDLLDISRITSGKIQLRRAACNLHEVIAKAIEMAGPLIEQRRHHLCVDVAEGIELDCDSVRLAQVISNLLINAAKFTEPGGRIDLAGARAGDHVAITVRDTGAGIRRELLEEMFKPFVQGAARSEGGLGLGLAIARSLVSLHGGTLSASSAGPGQGSEFVVTLPAAAPAGRAQVPACASNVRHMAPHVHGARVLLVDDNVDAATLLAAALQSFGVRVDVAHDGPAALDLAAKVPYDVALLDLGLPVMDGYELGRRLLRPPSLRSPVLVAITGYGEAADRVRTAEAGFRAHLVKPVEVGEVLGVISQTEVSGNGSRASARGG